MYTFRSGLPAAVGNLTNCDYCYHDCDYCYRDCGKDIAIQSSDSGVWKTRNAGTAGTSKNQELETAIWKLGACSLKTGTHMNTSLVLNEDSPTLSQQTFKRQLKGFVMGQRLSYQQYPCWGKLCWKFTCQSCWLQQVRLTAHYILLVRTKQYKLGIKQVVGYEDKITLFQQIL